MNSILSSQKKINILIGAHIGLPVGGIAKNYESLLNSDLKIRAQVNFIETSKGSLEFSERGGKTLKNFTNAFANVIRFTIALLHTKSEIVHLGTASGFSLLKHCIMAWIARILGRKVIMQFHFSYSKLNPDWKLKSLIFWLIGFCHGVIVISSEWEDFRNVYPKMAIKLIPNAIDTSRYADINRLGKFNKNTIVRFLYLGHLGKDKGTYDLISAIALLKNSTHKKFIMNLYGESLYSDEIENLLDEIDQQGVGDLIKINAPIYGEEKKKVFAYSDVFILPSYHEGMPISIIEAMSAGLPVVATNVGGIIDQVINRKTGLLVLPNGPQGLAEALKFLLDHPEARLQMGISGRQRAISKFDINVKVAMLIDFYEAIGSN